MDENYLEGIQENYEQRQKIDRELFLPLAEFFREDKPDFHAFRKIVLNYRNYRKVKDLSSAIGLVTEFFVKWSIDRFSKKTTIDLRLVVDTVGTIDATHKYKADSQGSILVSDTHNCHITELDGLYEYRDPSCISLAIEAKASISNSSSRRVKIKMHFADQIFGRQSYFCKFKPTYIYRNIGLSDGRTISYHRAITFPERTKELTEIASRIVSK